MSGYVLAQHRNRAEEIVLMVLLGSAVPRRHGARASGEVCVCVCVTVGELS